MERLAFLQWGDLRKNKKAILRYALTGEEAHLPVYLYVYLKELNEYDSLEKEKIHATCLKKLRETIEKKKPEKQWLLADDQIYRVALAFYLGLKKTINVYELGSTICNFKAKLSYLEKALRKKTRINYIGIEKNEFLIFLSNKLNAKQKIVKNLPKITEKNNSLFISRYVASYAFKKTEDFSNHLIQYKYAFISEPFYYQDCDFSTHNHGLLNVFFDFHKFYEEINKTHDIFSTSAFLDYPSGTDLCIVMNLVLLKRGKIGTERIKRKLNAFGISCDAVSKEFKKEILFSHSENDIQKIKFSKWLNPVWGNTDLSKEGNSMQRFFKGYKTKMTEVAGFDFKYENLFLSQQSLLEEIKKTVLK